MVSDETRLRNRLNILWETLIDHKTDERLLADNVVPPDILNELNIRVVPHVFKALDSASRSSRLNPSVLFRLRSPILAQHPINHKEAYFKLSGQPRIPNDCSLKSNLPDIYKKGEKPWTRGISIAHYFQQWAINGYHRFHPPGVLNVERLCKARQVIHPHLST
ncbi:hypothetical protein BDV06DRAFT_225537 [Aspergillus oleicola]